MLADALHSRTQDVGFGGFGDNSYSGMSTKATEVHFNIGTLVADDRGLKELERRQRKFRVEEDQRRGQAV